MYWCMCCTGYYASNIVQQAHYLVLVTRHRSSYFERRRAKLSPEKLAAKILLRSLNFFISLQLNVGKGYLLLQAGLIQLEFEMKSRLHAILTFRLPSEIENSPISFKVLLQWDSG